MVLTELVSNISKEMLRGGRTIISHPLKTSLALALVGTAPGCATTQDMTTIVNRENSHVAIYEESDSTYKSPFTSEHFERLKGLYQNEVHERGNGNDGVTYFYNLHNFPSLGLAGTVGIAYHPDGKFGEMIVISVFDDVEGVDNDIYISLNSKGQFNLTIKGDNGLPSFSYGEYTDRDQFLPDEMKTSAANISKKHYDALCKLIEHSYQGWKNSLNQGVKENKASTLSSKITHKLGFNTNFERKDRAKHSEYRKNMMKSQRLSYHLNR